VLELLGRQRVLEEEQVEWFEFTCQPDRIGWRETLVDVVEQLGLVTERAT
jgi:hypothetical protein